MATVKYTGTADVRKFLKSDFKKVGVEDQDAVQFDASNQFTADVSDAAAKYLTEKEAFQSVTNTAASSTSGESPDPSRSAPKSRS